MGIFKRVFGFTDTAARNTSVPSFLRNVFFTKLALNAFELKVKLLIYGRTFWNSLIAIVKLYTVAQQKKSSEKGPGNFQVNL